MHRWICSDNWQLDLYHNKRQSSRWESNQFTTSFSSTLIEPEPKYYTVKQVDYPSVNWFDYRFGGNIYRTQTMMDGDVNKSAVVNETINPVEVYEQFDEDDTEKYLTMYRKKQLFLYGKTSTKQHFSILI